jgi:hypothetical protein
VDRLFAAWEKPPAGDAVSRFRAVYTDRGLVNGRAMSCADLIERAGALHRAFDGLTIELIDRFDAPGRCAIVHRAQGRHTGPLATGESGAHRSLVRRQLTIDVLTIVDDKVSEIWMIGDDLDRLRQLGALALIQPQG